MQETKVGALRVWHIPQVPGKAFHVSVDSPSEAQRVLQVLAQYDIFQFKHKIKPDYCNAGGLEIYTLDPDDGGRGEWHEWYDEETDSGIDEWVDPETQT